MKGVVVPLTPGVLSALGGLVADLKNDFIRTLYRELTPTLAGELRESAAALAVDAEDWLEREHGSGLARRTLSFTSDMRYRGQSFEIEVPLKQGWIRDGDVAAIRAAFDFQHARLFGHADPAASVQMINLRLVIVSPTTKPRLLDAPLGHGSPAPRGEVHCHMDGSGMAVPFYRREDFKAGQTVSGAAIIAQDDTTTCVPPGMQIDVDRFGNLVITPVAN